MVFVWVLLKLSIYFILYFLKAEICIGTVLFAMPFLIRLILGGSTYAVRVIYKEFAQQKAVVVVPIASFSHCEAGSCEREGCGYGECLIVTIETKGLLIIFSVVTLVQT